MFRAQVELLVLGHWRVRTDVEHQAAARPELQRARGGDDLRLVPQILANVGVGGLDRRFDLVLDRTPQSHRRYQHGSHYSHCDHVSHRHSSFIGLLAGA